MRNTIITIMLTILFLLPLYSYADSIKVGLKYGSSAASSYTLSSENGFYIGTYDDGEFTASIPNAAYTTLNAVYENGSITLYGDDGNVVLQNFERYAAAAMDFDDGGVIKADGKEYRGCIIFTVNSVGTLNLINALDIDEYVYGVLNGEMHHGHPKEALKAQAVAARSFALMNLRRHSDYGFDVCTSTHCQVYKGYSDEYTETNAAVDETSGLCIYSGGKVVSAYYFKNSGGYTQDISDVWGSKASYLKAVKDEYSPEYKWSATLSFDEIKSKLGSAGNSIGDITRIEIVSRNKSGAVDTLKFIGTSGNVSISKEKIRNLFGASVIKSTHFSFSGYSTGNSVDNAENNNSISIPSASSGTVKLNLSSVNVIGSGGIMNSFSSKNSVSVMGADGKITNSELKNTYAANKDAVLHTQNSADSANTNKNTGNGDSDKSGTQNKANIDTSVEYVTESPVTFTGLGYGHGIGMPQDSAIEMAKQGFAFDEILKHYYTDIEIK